MGYSCLVALTHFAEGREEDYNDWYTWVHLRDVMRLGLGVVAAQRFRRSEGLDHQGVVAYEQPYLCIYEVTEPLAMTLAHGPVFTDEMPISDAFTSDNASEVYFDEAASINNEPGTNGAGDVIIERISSTGCSQRIVEWYLNERLPQLAQLPEVISASAGVPSDHQMFKQELSGLCALYRTADLAATAASWPPIAETNCPDGFDPSSVSVNSYAPVMDRLTMIDVRNPSDEAATQSRKQRERLGNRVLTGPPEGIETDMFD